MDERGSGWSSRPDDANRLDNIADDLTALQDDIAELIRILPARLEAGQRTAQDVFRDPGWGREPSAPSGPGRPPLRSGRGRPPLRFPADPIGRVEEQLSTLRREAARLLAIADVPSRPRAQGPARTAGGRPEHAGGSRSGTTLAAASEGTTSGGQAGGDAGDDALSGGLDPTEGPGGSGPQHKVKPEIVEPEPRGFGF